MMEPDNWLSSDLEDLNLGYPGSKNGRGKGQNKCYCLFTPLIVGQQNNIDRPI